MSKRRLSLAALVVGVAVAASSGVYCLTGRSTFAEPQRHNPRIHAALEALRDARLELRDAPHDFHGHKRAALEAVDKAIEHLDIIKEWDR